MSVESMIATSGHRIEIQGRMESQGTMGEMVRTWASKLQNAKCWVQPASAETIEQYGQLKIKITHCIYFAYDPGVKEGDRAIFNGRRFGLKDVRDFCELQRCWRVGAEEMP